MLSRILSGLVIAAVGILITIKSEWFYQNFGPINFGERFLIQSEGGSRLIYKMIGFVVACIGFLIITNQHYQFLAWVLRPLIPGI